MHIKNFYLVLSLACITFLQSCAQPSPTSNPISGSLKQSFSISQTVSIISNPFVQLPSNIWGAAFGGLIGGTLGAVAATKITAGDSDIDKYKFILASNNIDLKLIAYNSVNMALKKNSPPLNFEPDKSNTELQISVPFYGIHSSGPFSINSLEPMLSIEIKLVGSDGTVLWKSRESIKFPSRSQIDSHTMDEYAQTPALLSEGYIKLSDIIVTTLISQLRENIQFTK